MAESFPEFDISRVTFADRLNSDRFGIAEAPESSATSGND